MKYISWELRDKFYERSRFLQLEKMLKINLLHFKIWESNPFLFFIHKGVSCSHLTLLSMVNFLRSQKGMFPQITSGKVVKMFNLNPPLMVAWRSTEENIWKIGIKILCLLVTIYFLKFFLYTMLVLAFYNR